MASQRHLLQEQGEGQLKYVVPEIAWLTYEQESQEDSSNPFSDLDKNDEEH